jgi:hypothetical protein
MHTPVINLPTDNTADDYQEAMVNAAQIGLALRGCHTSSEQDVLSLVLALAALIANAPVESDVLLKQAIKRLQDEYRSMRLIEPEGRA